jgi:hypothetical protein
MMRGPGLRIANNLIGGTAPEVVIAVINLTTIARLLRDGRRAAVSDWPSN